MARGRTHEVVVHYVEDELRTGRLPVGGRLPAERALAEQLGVSRPSVREGIRVLEAMGLVRTSVGRGPDAGAVVVAEPEAGIGSALRLHLASRSLPVEDIVRTRVLLETWAVREAARGSVPPGDAAALLDAMDDPALSAADFLALDADFHVALARAAGNEVVAAIMAALRESIHGYVLAAVPGLPDWPAMQRRLRRQHRTILAAVLAGDAERAARLARAHIDGFYAASLPPT